MERRWGRIPLRVRIGAAGIAALACVAGLTQWPTIQPPAPSSSGTAHDKLIDEDAAAEQAAASGKRVEVTALRTDSSTTTALPNGSFELETHNQAIRAKVDGVWKPIDTALKKTEGGWRAKATNDPVVFSAGGPAAVTTATSTARKASGNGNSHAVQAVYTSDVADAVDTDASTVLAQFTTRGHTVNLTWPGTLPTPVISGARALYPEVLPGVDLLLTARDSGFSHVLIVKTAEAAASSALTTVSYGLTSPDLTFSLDAKTKTVRALDAEGNEIAVSPTPYMWDSTAVPETASANDDGAREAEAEAHPEPSSSVQDEPDDGVDDDAPDESGLDLKGTTDTAAPTASASPEASTNAEATQEAEPESSPSDAAYYGTGPAPAVQAAVLTTDDEDDPAASLSLGGLDGTRAGANTALAAAKLTTEDNGTSAVLTLTPDQDLLTGNDTEYPVFIDPPMTGNTHEWTLAYSRYPDSSFLNGRNFNDGTNVARVGYENYTGGKGRSFFELNWNSKLKGATVSSADFYLYETHSWSCSAQDIKLYRTANISSATTWNAHPKAEDSDYIDTLNAAKGWSSKSCAKGYLKFDAKELAQDAMDGGLSVVTAGLYANESTVYAWKKFSTNDEKAPYVRATYNRPPKEPTLASMTMTPGPDCDLVSPYSSVGKSDLVFAASSSDPDDTSTTQDLAYLHFQLWRTEHYATGMVKDTKVAVGSTGKASVTIAAGTLTNSYTYSWQVQAVDRSGATSDYGPTGTTEPCRFKYDGTVPNSPRVSSSQYPMANEAGSNWSTVAAGTAADFKFSPNGSSDTKVYEYSFNSTSYASKITLTAAGSEYTRSLTPPMAGPNVLYVRAVDAAGNTSEGYKYLFYVAPDSTPQAPGDLTGDDIPDLLVVNENNNLRLFNTDDGDPHVSLAAGYSSTRTLADAYWDDALITHNSDLYGGDGYNDLIARMPDGKLYVYPGDGYGSFDTAERHELILPSAGATTDGTAVTAPTPATFTQILATGDIDHDGYPDLLATSGSDGSGGSAALWAYTGYTGASYSHAIRLASTGWEQRDLVTADDFNSDGETDLLYRTYSSSRLLLRNGITNGSGGTTWASLATAAASLNAADTAYASSGWDATTVTFAVGTPDVSGDNVPDIWARMGADGTLKLYQGGASAIGSSSTVISADWSALGYLG